MDRSVCFFPAMRWGSGADLVTFGKSIVEIFDLTSLSGDDIRVIKIYYIEIN